MIVIAFTIWFIEDGIERINNFFNKNYYISEAIKEYLGITSLILILVILVSWLFFAILYCFEKDVREITNQKYYEKQIGQLVDKEFFEQATDEELEIIKNFCKKNSYIPVNFKNTVDQELVDKYVKELNHQLVRYYFERSKIK